MKFVVHVRGPADPGPGERMQMLERANRVFAETDVESRDVVRVDVPGRGASEDGDAAMRPEIEPAVPTLQSASLFGGKQGLMLVDANNLRAAEAGVLAELITAADPDAVQVVIVSGGAVPAGLAKAVKAHGESMSVGKLRERDVADWLASEIRSKRLSIDADAQSALLERFGSDMASLAQALDQLAMTSGSISADTVRSMFRNRPDEPLWRIGDAIGKGDVATALRRLSDYLTHGHPLVLLAFLEGDVRKRALAAAAPDMETFAEMAKVKADAYPTKLAWRARGKVSDSDLTRAVDAFVRADHTLKTAPEAVHRVTMERLVVALCRWYG